MTVTPSWAWISPAIQDPISQATLGGGIVPLETFTTNFAFVDANGDGLIYDRLGNRVPDIGEGVTVNGDFHVIDQLTTWQSNVQLKDGTSLTETLHVFRLDDGRIIYRFADGALSRLANAGVQNRNDLEEVQLVTVLSGAPEGFDTLSVNNHDGIFCFGRGTFLDTVHGQIPVEDLRVGSLVRTRDRGFQPIRWVGSVEVSTLADAPQFRPVRIRPNALGKTRLTSDLLVSPQHRVLVRSRIAQRMFGTDEILVAAKQLLEVEGIEIAHDLRSIEYFHILFDNHEVVFSNGAETESMHTGPEALRAVGPSARAEIFTLFPELSYQGFFRNPARPLQKGHQVRRLVNRHVRNAMDLWSS